ncbi:hypothetical protein Lser_V15G12750 [Lactuca serriola]
MFLCLLLVALQHLVSIELDKPSLKCGCTCIDQDGDGECERVGGIEYSDLDQVGTCSIPSPPEWPPLLQVPAPQYRAVRSDRLLSFGDLPNDSCTSTSSCPTAVLITGNNQSLGENLARNMFPGHPILTHPMAWLMLYLLGSASETPVSNILEPAFFSSLPVYYVQSQCQANSTFSISVPVGSTKVEKEIRCVQAQHLWRDRSSDINNELYAGYKKGNSEKKINEILAAGDKVLLKVGQGVRRSGRDRGRGRGRGRGSNNKSNYGNYYFPIHSRWLKEKACPTHILCLTHLSWDISNEEVTPQLFALLSSHPEEDVRKQLEGILVMLEKQSPCLSAQNGSASSTVSTPIQAWVQGANNNSNTSDGAPNSNNNNNNTNTNTTPNHIT